MKELDHNLGKKELKHLVSRKLVEGIGGGGLLDLKRFQTPTGKGFLKISPDLKKYYHTFSEYLNRTDSTLQRYFFFFKKN